MARPFKSGVDYFPLNVTMDDDVELLEAKHGLIGFGVLVKLYQKIYANNYWIKWDNKTLIVFSNRVNVCKNEVNAIINSCLEWNIFDKNLFDTFQILTSRGIQNRFFEITKRRKEVEAIQEYLLIDFTEKENENIVFVNINPVNVSKSTQSKVKEIERKKKGKEYTQQFLKLCEDYPGEIGSKSQTFKNYKTAKKKKDLSDDQIYLACMNSAAKNKAESKGDEIFYYQLSNVVGQKYSDDLPDLLNYKPPVKQSTESESNNPAHQRFND
jgi:hypothetical protein